MQRIESRLTFVINYKTNSDKETSQFLSSINKSKSDVEVVLLCDNNIKSKIEKSQSELIQKSRLNFASNYSAVSEQCSGSVIVWVDDIVKLNLNAILSWVNSNKKSITNDTIYLASRLADKKAKTPWQLKVYNQLYKFFTPSIVGDNNYGIIVSKTDFFESLVQFGFIDETSFQNNLLQMQLSGVIINEFSLNSPEKVTAPSFINLIATPISWFTYMVQWFVLAPIKSFKSGFDLANNNAGLYRLLFLLSTLFMIYFMPSKSFDFGITWDAKLHNEYGNDMLKYFESDGKDTTCFTSHRDYPFYGEHINVISSYINKHIIPHINKHIIPENKHVEFEVRHILNSIYGLLAIIFCGLIAFEMAGWSVGLIALWVIFLTPSFLGHSMNNPTDIPLAAGFSIGIYGIVRILKTLPKFNPSAVLVFAIGLGVAIGSRIVGILLVAYLGLFMGIVWLIYARKESFAKSLKLIWPYALILSCAAVLGYLLGLSLWPYGQFRPIANPLQSLTKSSGNAFLAYNTELWEGHKMYMIYTPWYYLIKFLGITLPLFVLVGLASAFAGVYFVFKNNKNKLVIALVLFTVIFPIVYAEIKNITYYNGWRHYLFIYPSMAAIAALGWNLLFKLARPIWLKYILLIALFGLAGKSTLWMIKNHPNEYVYYNEFVGGVNGAYGNYETDYYSNSVRAAAEWIAKNEPANKKLLVAINNEPKTASYYANKIDSNITFTWTRDYEEEKQFWDYQILTTRTYSKTQLLGGGFPPKGTVFEVKADDVPLAVVVKRQVWWMPLGYKAIDAQKIDSAIYYFKEAVKWDDKNEEAHRMYGFALMGANSFDSATMEFDKAIELYPENYSAYSNKALMAFNKKDFQGCIKIGEQAIKLKENLTEAYYYVALAKLNLNDTYGAIATLEKSIKNGGQIPEIYYYLGKAYETTNNTSKAAESFEYCLGMNQNFVQAWADLANVYNKLGRTQEAQGAMQRYQQLGGK